MWLFAAFVAVPLIEIGLFIQVGGVIGLWPTLAIVLVTALIGSNVVRHQGRGALQDLQQSFSTMRDPSEPLAHGAMILLAGALLVTPGFFTDSVGFALLFPKVRTWVMAYARKRITVQSFSQPPHGRGFQSPHQDFQTKTDVIDGEYADVSSDETPKSKDSGWTKHPEQPTKH